MSGIDSYTTLCLHADISTNPDASASNHTQTAHGAALISSLQSEFGGASMKFTASTNDYYTSSNSSDFDFGASDFTIDWWAYEISTAQPITHIAREFTATWPPFILSYNGGVWMSSNGSTWDIASSRTFGSPVFNAWSHLAIVRQGSTFYTFRNGIQQDTWTSTLTLPASSNPLSIGACQNGASHMNGYIDELRVSKGVARWTTNFTPSVSAYSAPPPSSTYGTVVASQTIIPSSPVSNIILIDTSGFPCARYQIEFDNVCSDIELIPQAGAALTVFCSINSGTTFLTGANYNSTGYSNFPGENNPIYNPQPIGLYTPQTLELGLRLGIDSGDRIAYGCSGTALIVNSGQAVHYLCEGVRGAIGGASNAIRDINTYPVAARGHPWFPSDGSTYFHWTIPYGFSGHFDGAIGSQVNAFMLTMGGGGNTSAKIASGVFRLRRMA